MPEKIRGDILVELQTNLNSLLTLKAFAGYIRTIQPFSETKTVKTYSVNTIGTLPVYFASEFDLVSKN